MLLYCLPDGFPVRFPQDGTFPRSRPSLSAQRLCSLNPEGGTPAENITHSGNATTPRRGTSRTPNILRLKICQLSCCLVCATACASTPCLTSFSMFPRKIDGSRRVVFKVRFRRTAQMGRGRVGRGGALGVRTSSVGVQGWLLEFSLASREPCLPVAAPGD